MRISDWSSDVCSSDLAQGDGYVDQASGALLSYQAHEAMHNAYEMIYQLHTGEGLWWLGLLLGLGALCVPLMSITGILMWWDRRRSGPNIRNHSTAQTADSVILVGRSEEPTSELQSLMRSSYAVFGLKTKKH